ncbi:MAG: cob(I)yrinic acid a,c-diamide adenosyltransferase [Sedimentisphaerales bacterium]|nr:cob(I)yrinic acid a,c-diamide adenosyltransferase [Sedimentisphaerales bacterium]
MKSFEKHGRYESLNYGDDNCYLASKMILCSLGADGEEPMSTKARVLIFTGDGKGKTTAAVGMAVRAVGNGMKVKVIQFVKEAPTGEMEVLKNTLSVEFVRVGLGFLPEESSQEFEKHIAAAKEGLSVAKKAIESGKYEIVVLDEICFAISKNLLEEKAVIECIKNASAESCIVLTGRNAPGGLIELADTVSEIKCIKHGYDHGIKAQKGVEF